MLAFSLFFLAIFLSLACVACFATRYTGKTAKSVPLSQRDNVLVQAEKIRQAIPVLSAASEKEMQERLHSEDLQEDE